VTALDVLSLIDQVLRRAARRRSVDPQPHGPEKGTGADAADPDRRCHRRDGGDHGPDVRMRRDDLQHMEEALAPRIGGGCDR
jgi:hypothetical protein